MAIIEAKHIVKRYANHCALNDVSIEVPAQSVFGLLGPNGAGKTSLIRIINQITGPDDGTILFDGKPLTRDHIARIGYLPEERGLYKKMPVGEQAIYLAMLKGLEKREAGKRLREWFERFDIAGWWDKKVEELSKGMAQKVQFITTVLHQPQLIILDEPFSGFDPINTNLIKGEILRLCNEGATIMLSTHNMGSVEEICTHIALINQAQVVLHGAVPEVRARYKEGTYDIAFQGEIIAFTNALWTGFELVNHRLENGLRIARIHIQNQSRVNDLLHAILPHVQVEGIQEVVPGMNDIFIKVVQQPTSASTAA